jgi:hypothetical protein
MLKLDGHPPGTGLVALRLVLLTIFGAFLLSCGDSEKSVRSRNSDATPAGTADRLVHAASLKEAMQATRQALSLAGIASTGDDGLPAAAPSSGTYALPTEVFFLATEARARESAFTMTLDEFGQMLADFEWPFLDESTPGEQIAALLREWGLAARQDTGSPHAFAPLFIAEMASLQEPPIDILTEEYDPAELRLSSLEIIIFAAAFRRFAVEEQASGSAWRWLPQPRTARAQTTCKEIQEWMGRQHEWAQVGGEIVKFGASEGTSAGLTAGLEKAGASAAAVKGFEKAMVSVDVALKLGKLAQLYKSTNLSVETLSDNPMHKAASNEAAKYSAFRANVGISQQDAAEFERLRKQLDREAPLNACAGMLGLPERPDFTGLSKDVDKGRITWRIIEGGTTHATISRDTNTWDPSGVGQLRMNLKRSGPHSADTTLVVDLTPEKKPNHQGEEKKARVTVRATLDTSEAPGLGTFLGAATGAGLVSSLVELSTGWFQSFFQPKAYGSVILEYHESGYWAFVGSYRDPYPPQLRPPRPVGGVACTDDVNGAWAFLSGWETVPSRDTLVKTINNLERSRGWWREVKRMGERTELLYEFTLQAVYEVLPGGTKVKMTGWFTKPDVIFDTQEFELFLIDDLPDICSRAR